MELFVEVCDSPYKYDFLLLKPDEIIRSLSKIERHKIGKKSKHVDAYFMHYLVKEFCLSQIYRIGFLNTFYEIVNGNYLLKFILLPTQKDLIDYNW